ncbi:TolC family outer membrane protein [Tranquillimonas alkanivorans]|uniref:Outer membrane protein n=1 Tax=Tranquillimonas alkanivorans TaxID=441119 RepID=A0A1I5M2P6_9RHOB|nr:TolC family outer membrane protein [Tranquillimonas alkanivorans]SFP03301.1 outer membrane protein [Tranquillimonas alkanivorans]
MQYKAGRKLLRSAALTLGMALAPVAASAESLTDAFIHAYRHSGLLEQNRALLRAADEDVAIAVARTRPVFSWAINRVASPENPGDQDVTTGQITGELTLFDFGANQLAIDAAKETVLVARERLLVVEQEVLFRAVQAYLDVRRTAAFVNLRQSNVRLIEQELRAARDRFEVGEVTRTDVSIAEARLAAAQSALAAAQGELAVAREEYQSAVGRYPDNLAEPPTPPQVPASLQAALAVAVKQQPSLRAAMREVLVADLNIERAEAAMKPTLTGNAQVQWREGFEDDASVGISFGGPLYTGGRLTALYRQAQAQRDAQRANLHVTRHDVELAVGTAWANLAVALASLEATDEEVRAATVAFRGVQEEATLGARTTLDVLNAEQELLDARANRISARIQEYLAVYALLRSMGLLTVDHLDLGIATYDPAAYYQAVDNAPLHTVSPQGERLENVLRAIGRN